MAESRKVVRLRSPPSVPGAPLDMAIGRPGLRAYGGVLSEEHLPQLRGQRGIKIYEEMAANDPIIAGFLFAISSILTGVDWHAEPIDSKNEDDVAAACFLDSCLRDMSNSWQDTLTEILSFLTFGFGFFEVIWKQRKGRVGDQMLSSKFSDGLWGWQQFAPRAQTSLVRWEIDETGRILGMWQRPPEDWTERFLSLNRGLLFRLMPRNNNPEGHALLRGCYRPWYIGKRLQELEAIGVERNLAGLPVLYLDDRLWDASDAAAVAKLDEYKKIIRNLKRDEQEGMLLPSTRDAQGNRVYELTLLSTGSRRQSDTNALIQRYNAEKAMAALSDFMLLGHSRIGTFALGVTKTDMFATAYSAVLDIVANEINEREVPRLFAINAMAGEARLVHGKVGNVDLEKFSAMVLRLAQAGLPVTSENGERERFIYDELGLPGGDLGGVLDPNGAHGGAPGVQRPEARTAPLGPERESDGGGD